MYNHDRKYGFARSYSEKREKWLSKARSRCRDICDKFDSIEPLERDLGVDLCEMDREDLERAFEVITGDFISTPMDIYALVKAYIVWCDDQGYRVKNSINEIRLDSVDEFKQKMISSPAHLRIILNDVFPNPSKNQLNYIYRSYLWLAMIGYEEEESAKIKITDVDFANKVIVPSDKTIRRRLMYNEAFDDLWYTCKMTSFDDYSRRRKIPDITSREDGDLLLRWIEPKKNGRKDVGVIRFILPAVSREFMMYRKRCADGGIVCSEIPGSYTSYHRVFLSGIFLRAANSEMNGVDPEIPRPWYMDDFYRWKAAFMNTELPRAAQ